MTVANQDGVKAVVAVKIADRWTVQAVVEKSWHADDPITYGVVVSGTF